MAKISVIIPVYNVEKYLKQCLDSVVKQTLEDIEIICINDGSTDNSPSILKEYATADTRIKIINSENKGAGAARNLGIQMANGEYLSFIDSDDFICPNMYEILYNKTNGYDIVICDFNYADDSGNIIEDKAKRFEYTNLERYNFFNLKTHPYEILNRFQGAPWNKLFKREFIQENKLVFQELKRANDIYFVRSAMLSAEKICCISEKLLFYRLSDTSLQATNHKAFKGSNDFIKALFKIKNFMVEKGLYENYSNEFKYFAKGMIEYNLKMLQNSFFAYKNLLNALKNNTLKTLDIKTEDINLTPIKKIIKKRMFNIRKNRDVSYKILTVLGIDFKFKTKKKLMLPSKREIKPLISVIICNYNGEEYLERCLNSIIGQSLQNIEVICVNDGSTDNSLKILENFAKFDKRIKIINQKNQGLATSRNNALKIATGKYISFVDADDWLRFDALYLLFNMAQKNKLDMLSFGGVNVLKETMEEKNNPYYEFLYLPKKFNVNCFNYKNIKKYLDKMAVSSCLTFYKTKFLKVNNIKFPDGICFEDNIFFTKALFLAKRSGILNEKLYYRLIHSDQITSNKTRHFGDYITMVKKIKELMDELKIPNKIKVKYISNYVKSANSYYQNMSEKDRQHFKQGIIEICKYENEILSDRYINFYERIFSVRKNSTCKQTYILNFKIKKEMKR